MSARNGSAAPAVYVQSNDATNNEVLAFERRADGRLAPRDGRQALWDVGHSQASADRVDENVRGTFAGRPAAGATPGP